MSNFIYAYAHDGQRRAWKRSTGHSGTFRIKVGQTSRPGMERVRESLRTQFPNLDGVEVLLLDVPATRPDGSPFQDFDVRNLLKSIGVGVEGEWVQADLDEVRGAIVSLQTGLPFSATRIQTFDPRPEQKRAVEKTSAYFRANANTKPRFLWNCKMRFGKTFTTYQLAREMDWSRLLVLTYKPAVQTAWRDDLLGHVDFANWRFVDRGTPVPEADALVSGSDPLVWFASFQDLLGTDLDGNVKKHNETIHLTDWDCIVIDEFHYGAWNESSRDLYDPADKSQYALIAENEDEVITDAELGLKTSYHLHLSGTPFRAITNGEYHEDQVFNWTYIDEQREKANWDEKDGPNPYSALPRMEMYTYRLGAETERWADDEEFNGFNLNTFFRATKQGSDFVFDRPDEVGQFLQMVRGKKALREQIIDGNKPPYPYEATKFASAVQHSVWYLPDVGACKAMHDLLLDDPYFSTYEIHVAAGGRAGVGAAALPPVKRAIQRAQDGGKSGTITLSCGKLMTGVTVPEWTSIFILRSLKSPETYFQAAFRVQSPWTEGGAIQKETCFVFEFDPNRALDLIARYGIELASADRERGITQRDVLGELINYLPIFAIDGGLFEQLDIDAVLEWANDGVNATSLARRWSAASLFELNGITMQRLLDEPDLLAELEQIEDFRDIKTVAEKMVTSASKIKQAKREKDEKDADPERKENAKRRDDLRKKLKKVTAKVLVFMYLTDFREEALIHVIKSLDSDLFLRTTGLSISGFQRLNEIGVFNIGQMEDAIRKFRYFEQRSLEIASLDDDQPFVESASGPVV